MVSARSNRRLEFTTYTPSRFGFFIGIVIVITGLIIATKYPIIGGIQALFGISSATYSFGTRIDGEKRLYKNYIKILGFYFGFWQKLPLDCFLLLKKLSDTRNYQSTVGDFTDRVIYYKIFLKTKNSKLSLPLLEELNEDRARSKAEEVAAIIDVELKIAL